MDEQITQQIMQLKRLQDALDSEMDHIRKEIDEVERHAFGVMNKVKLLVAERMRRTTGMEGVMGEAYAQAKHKEFKDEREYIEHLKRVLEDMRSSISNAKGVVAELEKCQRDYASLDSRTQTWLDRANALMR